MANLLLKAMRLAGHTGEVVSTLRSFTRNADAPQLWSQAIAERQRLLDLAKSRCPGDRPDIWFTYHPYYRAPDLIGPQVSRALRLAYVTAEASFAGKHEHDEWAPLQAEVKSAVRQAALNFCMTPVDRQGLLKLVPAERIFLLPPFIDTARFGQAGERAARGRVRLVTTAMMRPGVKLESYRILARALGELAHLDWSLDIIGDGPERAKVEAYFEPLPPGRVSFTGELDTDAIARCLRTHDVFVWPGIGEAYGLAYLEAQACGLPVVAVDNQGVPSVVCNGRTGLLSPPGDMAAFIANLQRMIGEPDLRRQYGAAARQFVHTERCLDVAARLLDQGLCKALQLHAADGTP